MAEGKEEMRDKAELEESLVKRMSREAINQKCALDIKLGIKREPARLVNVNIESIFYLDNSIVL